MKDAISAEQFIVETLDLDRRSGSDRLRLQELLHRLSPEECVRARRLQVGDLSLRTVGRMLSESLSPSGKYKLTEFEVPPLEKGTWGYCSARVERVGEAGTLFSVQRNYTNFPFAWVDDHPDGHDYMVCGEDYQGLTVLQLTTGKRADYLPKTAFEGLGFCHAVFHPSPTGTMLAVDGCYWAAPYEVRIYDFSAPMTLPWPLLSPDFDSDPDFVRWTSDEACLLRMDDFFCQGCDKWESEMSQEEQKTYIAAYTSEEYDAGVVSREAVWNRPDPLECARQAAQKYQAALTHWAKTETPENFYWAVRDDYRLEFERALSLVPKEDREALLGEWVTDRA